MMSAAKYQRDTGINFTSQIAGKAISSSQSCATEDTDHAVVEHHQHDRKHNSMDSPQADDRAKFALPHPGIGDADHIVVEHIQHHRQ